MNRGNIAKSIVLATLVCGTLDILLAMLLTVWRGREIGAMLRFVASGPFPSAIDWSVAGTLLGLLVHYTLMALMVSAFVFGVRRWPGLLDRPVISGLSYGLLTYILINVVVVPLRFPATWPPSSLSIGTQLFAHLVLVGLPVALIARRYLRG